ncbi:MAG: phosphatidylserine decarboxylase family protein [Bacteroidales bacterium]
MRVKIHREGLSILAALLFILLVINIPAYLFIRPIWISYTFISISVIIYLLVANFFRSPRRHFKGDYENAVVASADGVVVALEEVYEGEYLKRNVMQLSIFMNIFNVHANWYPVAGEVEYVTHHAGRFKAAYLPKSSTENERSTVVINCENGQQVLVRQIAGAMARRIVTYAQVGDQASIDDHMGFIKFGSRVDIYLPLDAEILVSLRDKTIGGVSQIARLKKN